MLKTLFWMAVLGASIARPQTPADRIVINVRNYGAKGNGTTDDTTAINNALAACRGATQNIGDVTAGGCVVWVPKPPTSYKVTTSLLLPNATTLACDGTGWGTTFTFTPSSSSTTFLKPDPSSANPGESPTSWQGLGFRGCVVQVSGSLAATYSANASHGVDFRNVRMFRVENNQFIGFMNAATVRTGFTSGTPWSYGGIIDNNWFRNVKLAAQFDTGANKLSFTRNKIFNDEAWPGGYLSTDKDVTVHMNGGCSIDVIGNLFNDEPTTAWIDDNGCGHYVAGNYFEHGSGTQATPRAYIRGSLVTAWGESQYIGNYGAGAIYKIDDTATAIAGTDTEFFGVKLDFGEYQRIGFPLDSSTRPYPNQKMRLGASAGSYNNGFNFTAGGSGTAELTGGYRGRGGIKLKHDGTAVNNSLFFNVGTAGFQPTLTGSNLYVRVYVKTTGTTVLSMFSDASANLGSSAGTRNFHKRIDFDSGWDMYTLHIPVIDASDGLILYFRQDAGTALNATLEISDMEFFVDGFDWKPTTDAVGEDWATAAPATGCHELGDVYRNAASNNPQGWRIITAGCFGALAATTGTMSNGSKSLTSLSQTIGIYPGAYVTVAGAGVAAADLTAKVTAISGTTATLDTAASTAVAGVAVTYKAAAYRVIGPLSATATWDPGNMASDGDSVSTTVTNTGVATTAWSCTANLSSIADADNVLITARPYANTVRVSLLNKTGGGKDIGSGTLRVDCVNN